MNNKSTLFNSFLSLSNFPNAKVLHIVQGDKTQLDFELKDKNLQIVQLEETTGQVHIIHSQTKTIRALSTCEIQDGKASFIIDRVLPVGEYEVAIKIGDYYFPSSTQSFILNIVQAHDVVDIDIEDVQTIDIVVDALRDDVVEALLNEMSDRVDSIINENPERFKGEKGDKPTLDDFSDEEIERITGRDGAPFVYENFTPQQLEELKGEDGKSFDWDSLTPEQKEEIKGEKGDALLFEDLTPEQIDILKGKDGDDGKSAYQLAVDNGFFGSEVAYLDSLHGKDGRSFAYEDLSPSEREEIKGKSAYEIAQDNGFEGSLSEWLESLVGQAGRVMTWEDLTDDQQQALKGAKGDDGKSAYDIAVENGFEGTVEAWLDSLIANFDDVDLSDYVRKEDLPLFENFVSKQEFDEYTVNTNESLSSLSSSHGDFKSTTELALQRVNENLGTKVERNDLEEIIAGISTPDLSNYATLEDIPDVSNFLTIDDIPDSDLSEYAKLSDIPSLDGLLTQEQADNLYVKKDEIVTGNDGKSAYDIAVENGFAGTEQEWLDSLKGDKGEGIKYEDLTPEQKDEMREGMSVRAPKIYTRAEYDALETYDEHTLYFVVEDDSE